MIRIHNLHKSFGKLQVLKGLSLDISEGEKLCIVGGSGSGKSVLIQHLLGLLKADSGEIEIDGSLIHQLGNRAWQELYAQFGVVFQASALFDSMSIWENVGLRLIESHQYSLSDIRDIVSVTLGSVNIGKEHLEKLPSQLSGGMQKRVAIARAIIHQPKYLFYDEPTTGLDPVSAGIIDQLIDDQANKEGRTSIIITHDLATVKKIGTKVAMLYEGEIIFHDQTEAFFKSDAPQVRAFLHRS